METINLKIPFDKKNWAKRKGCKWDSYDRTWYIIKDNIKPCLEEYIIDRNIVIRDTSTQYKIYQCNLHFTCVNPKLKFSIDVEKSRNFNIDEFQILEFIRNLNK